MNSRALTALTCLSILSSSLSGADLTDQQKEWLSAANRHEKAGWIYLHLQGGPRERGFQHGYLAAKEIAEGLRVTRTVWKHESSMEWSWLVANTKGFMEPAIDPENRDELKGIVEGMLAAGEVATYDDIVTYNAQLELRWYWWPNAQKKLTDGIDIVTKPRESCSSFIATGKMTADGGVVLGHNTWDDYDEARENIIVDIAPITGHRILMQTMPGWIHSGTDFFITDAGIVGSETTIGHFEHFSQKGIPEFVRMRRATQDAANLDQWCAIMKKGNNGGYANAWLVGDINTREIARLELGLKYIGFERTTDGYYTGSNIAEDPHLLRLETDGSDNDIRGSSVARRVRWKQLMKENQGKIDIEVAKAMEADSFDVYLGKTNPGSRTIAGHCELESMMIGGGNDGAPFEPLGAVDCKVVDTRMAKAMSFAARWGSADGTAFDAEAFLTAHPQYDWMQGILMSRAVQPWAEFTAGEER